MKLVVIISIILTSYISTTQGQSRFWQFVNANKYDDAIALSATELKIALQRYTFLSPEIGDLHSAISKCYKEKKKYSLALDHLTNAYTIYVFINGDSSLLGVYECEELAQLYFHVGNYLDAACYYEKCFIINRKHKGELSQACIDNLNVAAICYDKANNLALAERNYLIVEKLLAENEVVNERMLRIVRQSLKHLYRVTKNTDRENAIDVKLGILNGNETTNKVKVNGEKCDCINHLVPAEELRKLGITVN